MTVVLEDPQVRAYLDELRRLTTGSADQDLVVDGLARHIEDALGTGPMTPERVRAVLDELGDPAVIAADALPALAPGPAPFLERRSGVVLTVLLLTFGGVVLPVVGWVVGLVLLWTSRAWTVPEKVIGTVAPAVLAVAGQLIGLAVSALGAGDAVPFHLLLLAGAAVGAVAAAVLLLARARTRG